MDGEAEVAGLPRDPELWRLTLSAVRGVAAAADAYIERGGWCPRVRLASVRAFDSGWPNLSRPMFAPEDAPLDFADLFGVERSDLKPVGYRDVPEMVTLLEYVQQREDLRTRLLSRPVSEPDDLIEVFSPALPA